MASGEARLHDLKNRAVSVVMRRQGGSQDFEEELAVAAASLDLYEHLCLTAGDCVRAGLWSPRMLAEVEKRLARLRTSVGEGGTSVEAEGMAHVRDQLMADYSPGSPARGVARLTFFGGPPVATAIRVVADCLLGRELASPLRAWWHRDGEHLALSVVERNGAVAPLPIRLPARALEELDGGVLVEDGGKVKRCET